MNPDLDLSLQRLIRAPRERLWTAWTDPDRFARWWLPEPSVCRVERLDVTPGGGLVTLMSDDGVSFSPHLDACFIAVEPLERIVFTNVIDSQLRPQTSQPIAMTADIQFHEHPEGTDYRVVVRHGSPEACRHHVDLGFFEGWGMVTAQLAALAESHGTG